MLWLFYFSVQNQELQICKRCAKCSGSMNHREAWLPLLRSFIYLFSEHLIRVFPDLSNMGKYQNKIPNGMGGIAPNASYHRTAAFVILK